MSWAVLLALAAGSYALKALGLLGLPQLEVTKRLEPITALLPRGSPGGAGGRPDLRRRDQPGARRPSRGCARGAIATWLRAPSSLW